MRVFVISDSHGDMEAIKKAVRLAGDFDRIFHLGDSYRDALKLAEYTGIAVDAVAGNCDFVDAPSSSVVVLRGKRFFLTHGHNYGVGFSLTRLKFAAEEAQADVALFGHTHRAYLDYSGSLMLLNPGSISRPRDKKASFAVIEISSEGVISAKLHIL